MEGAIAMNPKPASSLAQSPWSDIMEPGAYVDHLTGDLYRIPAQALVNRASSTVSIGTSQTPRFVRLSRNPFVTLFEARRLSARHRIEPNF